MNATVSAFHASGSQAKTPKLLKADPKLMHKLLREEKDERYRYLIRHGIVHYIEQDTFTLYVELK